MARKKIKKQDDFQESIWALIEFTKKNATILMLALAVVVAGVLFFYTRRQSAQRQQSEIWQKIIGDYSAGQFEEFKNECPEGSMERAWMAKRQGDALFVKYKKDGAFRGDHTHLLNAKKAYEEALAACGDEPNLKFSIQLGLKSLEKELASPGVSLEPPELKVTGNIQLRDWGMPADTPEKK